MGATLGNTLTPPAMGLLLENFAWQRVMESQFLVGLAAAGLVWLYAARMFEGDEVPTKKPKPFQEIKELARNPVVLVLMLVRSFNQIARQVTMTFLPIYLVEYLGYADFGMGVYLMIMSVSGLVAQPVMGVLSDRLGRKAVLAPSLLILGLVYFLLQWATAGVALAVVVVAIGFLFYTVANVTTAAALDVAGKGSQASSFGLVSLGTHILVVPRAHAGGIPHRTLRHHGGLFLSRGLPLGGRVRRVPAEVPEGLSRSFPRHSRSFLLSIPALSSVIPAEAGIQRRCRGTGPVDLDGVRVVVAFPNPDHAGG